MQRAVSGTKQVGDHPVGTLHPSTCGSRIEGVREGVELGATEGKSHHGLSNSHGRKAPIGAPDVIVGPGKPDAGLSQPAFHVDHLDRPVGAGCILTLVDQLEHDGVVPRSGI